METFINKILLGEGTLINKNITWGGDVYKQKVLLGEGTFINKNFTWGGMGRLWGL